MKTSTLSTFSFGRHDFIPTDTTIRCTVYDGDRAIHLTEEMLDAWFVSLAPAEKAELYKAHLEGSGTIVQSGTCRYCSCTDDHACNPPCCWIDAEHTVCSADVCVEKHEAANAELYHAELQNEAPAVLGLSAPFEPALRLVDMQVVLDSWADLSIPRRRRCAGPTHGDGGPGLRIVEVANASL